MNETQTQAEIEAQAHAQRRNRLQMIAIMSVALISLGSASLLYWNAEESGGWNTTNNGEWVKPALSTAQLQWSVGQDQRKWWLWMVSDGCDSDCVDSMDKLEALHILLNREADRVRRGYTDMNGSLVESTLSHLTALETISFDPQTDLPRGIYIVDPLGNLVLRYEVGTNPKLILQDFKKLLKLSQIG